MQGELICFIAPGRLLLVYGRIQRLLQALWKFTCKRFHYSVTCLYSLPVHTEAKLYFWSAFNGLSDYAGGILELQKQVGLIEGWPCTHTLCSCAGAAPERVRHPFFPLAHDTLCTAHDT